MSNIFYVLSESLKKKQNKISISAKDCKGDPMFLK